MPHAARGGHRDVLAAVLLLLDEWPMRRSRLRREMSERSGASWSVGQASVAAALESLEDAGMVGGDDVENHAVARLTGRGAAFVEEHRGCLGEPWDEVEDAAAAVARDTGARTVTGAGPLPTTRRPRPERAADRR